MNCRKCCREIPDGSIYCMLCGAKQQTERRKTLKRANGMGTVYRLSGRRKRPWVAAKGRVVIGYYETKTDAMKAMGQLCGRTLTERYNMTFAQVFESWRDEHYREIGPKGIESYNNSFKVFSPLHEKQFRSLKTADFQAIIDQREGKSHSALSKDKQLVTQMSDWAIREEIITTNFATFVKLPKPQKKEKEIFTDLEIKKLEDDESEAAKIVMMLICTGMRIGELFSLPLEDYHDTYCVGGVKTEAGKNRVIPIRPDGREYFRYFAAQANGPLLLSGYIGQKVAANFRRRDYYPLLDRLGIDRKSPHATRHTYASRARSDGMRPEILQKILGHADYSTTANIYVHSDIHELLEAVEPPKTVSNLLVTERGCG